MNKKSNGLLIALIFMIILSIGLAGYICYDKLLCKIDKDETSERQEKNYQEKKENDKVKYVPFSPDSSKCLTDCSNITYSLGSSVGGDGIEVWNDGDRKINVNIGKYLQGKESQFNSVSGDMITYEFAKTVQDTFVGVIGQDDECPALLVLFDDGTVEYIDLYSKILNDTDKREELKNVKNVKKFYSAGSKSKNSEMSGIMTILAETSDGSFYDLEKIIYK